MPSLRPLPSALRAAQIQLLQAANGDLTQFVVLARELDGGSGCLREAVEAATYKGMGPLHAAAAHGNMLVCVYLVEQLLVNIKAVDKSGKTPIDWALQHGHSKIVQYLRYHVDKMRKEPALLFGPAKGIASSPYSSWGGKSVGAYVNWQDYIPSPSYMFLPNREWRGTCIGHALGECITSRRRIMASRSKEPVKMSADVSIPWLIHELSEAHRITSLGGKAEDVSDYIVNNGAPLKARTDRAHISGSITLPLVNLQEPFDMPHELFTAQLSELLQQRVALLQEIETKGPVIGLFIAGPNWPDANGEVYHDQCDHVILRSKGNAATYVDGHAALIYGFDNSANDLFAVDLLLQDNNGPTSHTNGRCRMDISSLRGYMMIDVASNSPRKRYHLDVSSSPHDYLGMSVSTSYGENNRIKYGLSYMQGWNETVEEVHVALPDIDDFTSFFGVYDGHGGTSVASYCAEYFHCEVLRHANDTIANAIEEAFFRLDEIMVEKWEEELSHATAEGSTACVVVVRGNKLIIGSAGDSRAVLSRNGQAVELTIDHTVDCEYESMYSSSANREVLKDELGVPLALGALDISKLIGFVPFKQYTYLSGQEVRVTCTPDIRCEDITDCTEFLLIASDGLWNHVTSQSAVNFVNMCLKQGETNMGAICEDLINYCNAGCDNMTAVLIQFKKHVPATDVALKSHN